MRQGMKCFVYKNGLNTLTNISFQIEQFIETLYPRQDPAKLTEINNKQQAEGSPTDPGEGAVMFFVVGISLISLTALMVCRNSAARLPQFC